MGRTVAISSLLYSESVQRTLGSVAGQGSKSAAVGGHDTDVGFADEHDPHEAPAGLGCRLKSAGRGRFGRSLNPPSPARRIDVVQRRQGA